MKYGHFDDRAREYVITRPDTPRSWSNYLGSIEYGVVLTNNAGGYSFYKSSALGRVTRLRFNAVPMDQPGRYIYLRDRASGDYWTTSWQPVAKDLKTFKTVCRHGTGYSVFETEYSGIRSETTYFVPRGRNLECWVLRLTNRSRRRRSLRAFSYVEYTGNWSTSQDLINLQFSQYCTRMRVEDGAIISANVIDSVPENPDNFVDNDQGRHSFLTVVGADVTGFDTDREAFLGPYRTYANPLAVERGACAGSLADGDNGCGTLQIDVDLKPGESREVLFLLGVGRAETEGRRVRREFRSPAVARKALRELKAYWHGRLGTLIARTPDGAFDSMTNVWSAYNALMTYSWSRMASLVYAGERNGLGFRDTVQDLVAVMSMVAPEARERLELMLTGQYSTGGAKIVVMPFDHHPGQEPLPREDHYRSDDCLWFFNAVPEYVKETGDLAFYDKVLPFADRGEATVFGHLRRAIEFNLDRRGAHGLPCGLEADWNDCLRLGQRGESLFVSFQLRLALAAYIDIAGRLNRPDEAAWARPHLEALEAALREHAWDGAWFVRAFKDTGEPVGSRVNEEGRIFLNAQSWSIISGFATPEQGQQAMDSVARELATEYGLMICTPPFRNTPYHVVRAVLINGGMKENGGIFTQTQPWAVMAEAILGRGDRAYDYYCRYLPAAYNERAEVRQIEPYVFCQSTHSRFSGRYGASRIPWLSGSAAWSYLAATQYLLGIRPDYDGLRVDPCLPTAWKKIAVTRRFRGMEFRIAIRNGPKGKGVRRLAVNGQAIAGDLVPLAACRRKNVVEVELA